MCAANIFISSSHSRKKETSNMKLSVTLTFVILLTFYKNQCQACFLDIFYDVPCETGKDQELPVNLDQVMRDLTETKEMLQKLVEEKAKGSKSNDPDPNPEPEPEEKTDATPETVIIPATDPLPESGATPVTDATKESGDNTV